jgi:hypothetical protein
MPNLNTKIFLEIRVKDYPIGKNIKCHLWLEGNVSRKEAEEYIKNSLLLTGAYKNYIIHEIYIHNLFITNTKYDVLKENYGELILDSITNSVQTEKKKEKKMDITDIKYSELSLKDIESINNKITDEIFKRKYNLNFDEYKFYIDNKEEIDITDIKEAYKKCGGDIFKLRKEKIRDYLNELPQH